MDSIKLRIKLRICKTMASHSAIHIIVYSAIQLHRTFYF
jgi:hypothetical protein